MRCLLGAKRGTKSRGDNHVGWQEERRALPDTDTAMLKVMREEALCSSARSVRRGFGAAADCLTRMRVDSDLGE